MSLSGKENEEDFDPEQFWRELAAEQELQVEYSSLPICGLNGKLQAFYVISYPEIIGGQSTVLMAEGHSESEAKKALAKKALEFLQELSRP